MGGSGVNDPALITTADFARRAVARGCQLKDGFDGIVTTAATLGTVIDLAEELSLVVLGLDGFNLDGAEVVPMIDFIADFSSVVGDWAKRVDLCAAAARELQAHWQPSPDLIEVTLDGFGNE